MDALATIVGEEAEAVKRFIGLLREEQKSLGEGAIDTLADLIERKTLVAGQLTNLAALRNARLQASGHAPDRAGVEAWLGAHPDDRETRTAWNEVLTQTAEARELNRVNGELIKMRMQHNTNALEALLGASRPLSLYGPDGQTSPLGNRRINDAA